MFANRTQTTGPGFTLRKLWPWTNPPRDVMAVLEARPFVADGRPATRQMERTERRWRKRALKNRLACARVLYRNVKGQPSAWQGAAKHHARPLAKRGAR